MRSRHCAAECRLDRWSSCIRSMSDLGQSAVLTVRRPLPAFPHKQTFSGSVGMSQWCQIRTHAPQQTTTLFDHLVGAGEQCRWHNDAKRLCGLQIDHQLELGRLFDRQVGRLRTLENLVDEDGGPTK
jgi:hypothetical protein